MLHANDLSQFSFKKTGSGCYYVTYTTPNGRYYWGYTINDMGIIDDTLNAERAKLADIKHLRHICLTYGSKHRVY